MATAQAKRIEEIYRRHAEMCKVFSHHKRLELIDILRDNELNVGELASRLKITIGNLSQHLTIMKQRRVLAMRKEGNEVYYHVINPKLLKAFDLIRNIMIEQIERDSQLIGDA